MRKLAITTAIVLGTVLAACGDDDGGASASLGASPGSTPGVIAFTIVTDDAFAFEPRTLEVPADTPVTLTLENHSDKVLHDFTVERINVEHVEVHGAEHGHDDDHDLHVAAQPGEHKTLEFTPTAAGTYEFYCSVAGHRDAGMHGTLTVTPRP